MPAMNASFWATGSCSPIGWPHCSRSPAHSRAIFSAYLVVAAQIAGSDSRPVFSVDSAILQALALAADDVLGRDEDVVEPRHRVLDAAQAHERVAVRRP